MNSPTDPDKKLVSEATKLKVTQIGNSLGVVLPRELLAEMGLAKGDEIFVRRTPEGHVFSTVDPEFEKAMTTARDIMKRYRNTLRELAK